MSTTAAADDAPGRAHPLLVQQQLQEPSVHRAEAGNAQFQRLMQVPRGIAPIHKSKTEGPRRHLLATVNISHLYIGQREPNMRYLLAAVIFTGLVTSVARSEQPNCRAQVAGKQAQTACKPAKSKARSRNRDGISRGDAERNDRAQTRNILQSIEGELRRRRLGN